MTIPDRYRDPNLAYLFFAVILLGTTLYILLTLPTPNATIKDPGPISTPEPTVVITLPKPTPTPTIVEPKEIIVFADSDYGFYQTRGSGVTDKLNFTLNPGDTVTWINYDFGDYPVYIQSQEKLWTGYQERLLYNYRKLSYTFNASGDYTVTIREAKRDNVMVVTVK